MDKNSEEVKNLVFERIPPSDSSSVYNVRPQANFGGVPQFVRPPYVPVGPIPARPADGQARKDMRTISVLALDSIENAPDKARLIPVYPPPPPGMFVPAQFNDKFFPPPPPLHIQTRPVLSSSGHPILLSPAPLGVPPSRYSPVGSTPNSHSPHTASTTLSVRRGSQSASPANPPRSKDSFEKALESLDEGIASLGAEAKLTASDQPVLSKELKVTPSLTARSAYNFKGFCGGKGYTPKVEPAAAERPSEGLPDLDDRILSTHRQTLTESAVDSAVESAPANVVITALDMEPVSEIMAASEPNLCADPPPHLEMEEPCEELDVANGPTIVDAPDQALDDVYTQVSGDALHQSDSEPADQTYKVGAEACNFVTRQTPTPEISRSFAEGHSAESSPILSLHLPTAKAQSTASSVGEDLGADGCTSVSSDLDEYAALTPSADGPSLEQGVKDEFNVARTCNSMRDPAKDEAAGDGMDSPLGSSSAAVSLADKQATDSAEFTETQVKGFSSHGVEDMGGIEDEVLVFPFPRKALDSVADSSSPSHVSETISEPITGLTLSTCSKPQSPPSQETVLSNFGDSTNSSGSSHDGSRDESGGTPDIFACKLNLQEAMEANILSPDTSLSNIQTILSQARYVENAEERQDLVQTAIVALKQLAARNCVDAVYTLANLSVVGVPGFEEKFHEPDWEQAFKGYFQASKLGHVEAYFHLACCYLHGKGTKRSVQRANEFFRRAAIMKQPGAMYKQAAMLLDGELGTTVDPKAGIKWLKMAAKYANFKYPQAIYRLAMYHENGFLHHVFQDHAYAVQLLLKAAGELHCADSQCTLGECYQSGRLSVHPDAELARYWYMQAASQGHPEANYRLGSWYLARANWPLCGGAESETSKEYQSSLFTIRHLYRAASLSHLPAMYALGQLVASCRYPQLLTQVGPAFDQRVLKLMGNEKVLSMSQQWFLRAAAGGHQAALKAVEALMAMDANAVKRWYRKYTKVSATLSEPSAAQTLAVPSPESLSPTDKSNIRGKFRGFSASLPRKFGSGGNGNRKQDAAAGASTLLRIKKPRRLSITRQQTMLVACSPTDGKAAVFPSQAEAHTIVGSSASRGVDIGNSRHLLKGENWAELSVSPKWSVTENSCYGGLMETMARKEADQQVSMPLTSRNFSIAPHGGAVISKGNTRSLVRAPTLHSGSLAERRSARPISVGYATLPHPVRMDRRLSAAQQFDSIPLTPRVSLKPSLPSALVPEFDERASEVSLSAPTDLSLSTASISSGFSNGLSPPSPLTSVSTNSTSFDLADVNPAKQVQDGGKSSPANVGGILSKQAPPQEEISSKSYLKFTKSLPRFFSFNKQKV